jgi:hypothetical protein
VTSRTWKKTGVVLAILAGVFVLAAIIIPKVLDLNRYRGRIVAELESALGGQVTLGEITWGVSNGLWMRLHDLTVRDATAAPLDFDLPEAYVRVAIRPLFSKRLEVASLQLTRPSVTVRLAPPADDEELQAPDSSSTSPPVPLKAEHIRLTQGNVTIVDSLTRSGATTIHKIIDVNVIVNHFVPGEEIEFRVYFRDTSAAGLGTLETEGTFGGLTKRLTIENPRLDASAGLTGFHIDAIKPYINDKRLASRLRGGVSLKVKYKGNLGGQSTAEGQFDLSDFSYTDRNVWEKPLPGLETKIDYRLELAPNAVHIDKLDIRVGGTYLLVSGVIQDTTGQVVLSNVALSGHIPLTELIPLVPWRLAKRDEKELRDMLSSGGTVEIDHCSLSEIELKQLTSDPKMLLRTLNASLRVNQISMRPSVRFPMLEGISANLELKDGDLTAKDVEARYRAFQLPSVEMRFDRLTEKYRSIITAKGPIRLEDTQDAETQKLLQSYGLHSLSGDAYLDMRIDYDLSKEDHWDSESHLTLNGLSAESHPERFTLENLRGRITLRRKTTIEVVADSLSGLAEGIPFQLSGKLVEDGADELLIDASVRARGVDLGHFVAFRPKIAPLKLSGVVDADFDIRYSRARAAETQLDGTFATRSLAFSIPDQNLEFSDVEADITLHRQFVRIDTISLKINDQELRFSGYLSNPDAPSGWLRVDSPDFDFDQVLGVSPLNSDAEIPKSDLDSLDAQLGGPAALPSLIRDVTLKFFVDVTKGRYRKTPFRDLKLQVDFEQGSVNSHQFGIAVSEGTFSTKGSADLRNLNSISFNVQPDLKGFRIETLERLASIDSIPIKGPVNLSGTIAGRTGSTQELLSSLDGNIRVDSGPGFIATSSRAGRLLFDLLSTIKLSGFLSGNVKDDVQKEGFPYDDIKISTEIRKGEMTVDTLRMVTTAMTVDGRGIIDLNQQSADLVADIAIFETANEILGMVPLVGKAAADFVSLRATLKGPLDDPEITVSALGGLTQGVKDALKGAGKSIKGIFR